MKASWKKWVGILVLTIMGFTHGGGYALASQLAPSTPSNCCPTSCGCSPGSCKCHHPKGTRATWVHELHNPNCNPIKKIIQVGFDTSPSLLTISIRVFPQWIHTTHCLPLPEPNLLIVRFGLLRPPQVS